MLVDLLNYGSAAQTKFNYRTNALANASLTPEQQALGTQADVTEEGVPEAYTVELAGTPQVLLTGKSAVFGNRIELKYYFELAEGVDISDVFLELKYTDVTGAVHTSGTTAYQGPSGGEYAALYSAVAAKDMGQQVEAWFENRDGEKISDTLFYSLENYFFNRLKKSDDEDFKALVRAALKFSRSAKAYFESEAH